MTQFDFSSTQRSITTKHKVDERVHLTCAFNEGMLYPIRPALRLLSLLLMVSGFKVGDKAWIKKKEKMNNKIFKPVHMHAARTNNYIPHY